MELHIFSRANRCLNRKKPVRDMTEGSIVKQVILFALPLMLGNVFQMLYNTVDSIVVGHFVGTQALAAAGSATMIVNMMVFFNGFSTGAGVVIANCFGAKDMEKLHKSIETIMAAAIRKRASPPPRRTPFVMMLLLLMNITIKATASMS